MSGLTRAELLEAVLRALVNLEDPALMKVWQLMCDGQIAYGHYMAEGFDLGGAIWESDDDAQVPGRPGPSVQRCVS